MLLSARVLDAVGNVNIFTVVQSLEITAGDSGTLYLQLIDSSLDGNALQFNPPGRRYVPAAGATLTVVFNALDDARKVTRAASQPFPGDGSIWTVPFLAGDALSGLVDVLLTLTEGVKVTTGRVQKAIFADSGQVLC